MLICASFCFSPYQEVTEFARIYNTYRQDVYAKSRNNSRLYKPSGLKSPASVDWRDKNVVTRVKNQVHLLSLTHQSMLVVMIALLAFAYLGSVWILLVILCNWFS